MLSLEYKDFKFTKNQVIIFVFEAHCKRIDLLHQSRRLCLELKEDLHVHKTNSKGLLNIDG